MKKRQMPLSLTKPVVLIYNKTDVQNFQTDIQTFTNNLTDLFDANKTLDNKNKIKHTNQTPSQIYFVTRMQKLITPGDQPVMQLEAL